MSYTEEEAAVAVEFARKLEITASLDQRDGKTLQFKVSPPIPDAFHEEIRTILNICIEYHKRSVFTGEYLALDENPPVYRAAANPLDEINFFLKHYRYQFIKEVIKGLDISEETNSPEIPKRVNTPWVEVMLKHKELSKKKP